MHADIAAINTELKDTWRFDHGPSGQALRDLHALRNFCRGEAGLSKAFAAWEAAYVKLGKEMTAQGSVANLTASDLQTLVYFCNPNNPHGIAKVNPHGIAKVTGYKADTPGAHQFLTDFSKGYGTALQAVLCDVKSHHVASQFTQVWRKYVDRVVDWGRDRDKYQINRTAFVEPLNCLANDATFVNAIGTGFAKGAHFHADPEKVQAAMQNPQHPLMQFDAGIMQLIQTAQVQRHDAYRSAVNDLRSEFTQKVQPAIKDYRGAVDELDRLQRERHPTRGRQWI